MEFCDVEDEIMDERAHSTIVITDRYWMLKNVLLILFLTHLPSLNLEVEWVRRGSGGHRPHWRHRTRC